VSHPPQVAYGADSNAGWARQTGHLEPFQNSIKGTIDANIARVREYVSVENLRANWLLSLVPDNVLAVLASMFQLRVVGKGGLILSAEEGAADQPATTCVVLVSGSALVSTRLVDGRLAHRVVEEGEVINEVRANTPAQAQLLRLRGFCVLRACFRRGVIVDREMAN
jgi:hypothetical protein